MKIAILSDIHANIYAFEAVLKVIAKEKIEKTFVAGDLIGYYYWPKEIIEICMNNKNIYCIKGNHEQNFLRAIKDSNYMLKTIKKYGSSYKIASEVLSSQEIDWLKNLPLFKNINLNNNSLHITHGSLDQINKYIYPDSNIESFKQQTTYADYTILGHTHYPFIFANDGKWLINPGSVGQPRDNCFSASFFILDLKTKVVIPKRVTYEFEDIIKKIDLYDNNLIYLKKPFFKDKK